MALFCQNRTELYTQYICIYSSIWPSRIESSTTSEPRIVRPAVTSRNVERATLVHPITSSGILFRSGRGRRHPVREASVATAASLRRHGGQQVPAALLAIERLLIEIPRRCLSARKSPVFVRSKRETRRDQANSSSAPIRPLTRGPTATRPRSKIPFISGLSNLPSPS